MKQRRTQFSLSGIMLATFWFAVCFWAWSELIYSEHRNGLASLLAIGSPITAFGALRGNTEKGVVAAMFAVFAFLLLTQIFDVHVR